MQTFLKIQCQSFLLQACGCLLVCLYYQYVTVRNSLLANILSARNRRAQSTSGMARFSRENGVILEMPSSEPLNPSSPNPVPTPRPSSQPQVSEPSSSSSPDSPKKKGIIPEDKVENIDRWLQNRPFSDTPESSTPRLEASPELSLSKNDSFKQ